MLHSCTELKPLQLYKQTWFLGMKIKACKPQVWSLHIGCNDTLNVMWNVPECTEVRPALGVTPDKLGAAAGAASRGRAYRSEVLPQKKSVNQECSSDAAKS